MSPSNYRPYFLIVGYCLAWANMAESQAPANQRILKNFFVGNIPVLFGSIDILPNGGVVIPDFQQNRVVEYDGEGKIVTQFQVQWPNFVMGERRAHRRLQERPDQSLPRRPDRPGRHDVSLRFSTG